MIFITGNCHSDLTKFNTDNFQFKSKYYIKKFYHWSLKMHFKIAVKSE